MLASRLGVSRIDEADKPLPAACNRVHALAAGDASTA
jgi:hypothetical protein